jgi:glycosyltransferase involved in cell wall biosynthesis
MLDERVYRPLPDVPKKFAAVYDARLKPYKRHQLAAKIPSLALIYDFKPDVDDSDYVARVRQEFAHATFLNHPNGSGYVKLTNAEVNRHLNECCVGLCLSAVEGGMYASMQYLLAGLPIVSTESKGGRDVFFDESYVLIVDDNSDAVAEGVKEMERRGVPAQLIRATALERMQSHRRTFVSLVQRIYEREGTKRSFDEEWDTVFFDKLIKRQLHTETIRQLKDRNKSSTEAC